MESDRDHCIAVGMDAYISKPIVRSILEDVLEQQLMLNMPSKNFSDQVLPVGSLAGFNLAENEIVDMCRLKDMFGDDHETESEMLELFVLTTTPLFDKLTQAINQLRFTDITAIGHQIKGSCANLGITELATIADKIEQAGKCANITLAQQLCVSAFEAFARLRAYIQHERTES